jgi:hypothetical protein
VRKKKPRRIRRINVVSVLLALVVASGAYFGWKLIPVYYQAHKVDTILASHRRASAELDIHRHNEREDEILEKVEKEVRELGIDDPYMQVRFSPDYTSLHVDYSVEVRFFFGKSKTLRFARSVEIPRDDF